MPRDLVLLVNLGTPAECNLESVKEYLDEFLMDPMVLQMPSLLRTVLVKGVIVPFRSKGSLAKYKKVWTAHGSPQRFHMENLKSKLQQAIGDAVEVDYGFRYGAPSLAEKLQTALALGRKVYFFSLYPHFATSSSGTANEKAKEILKSLGAPAAQLTILPHYYRRKEFVESWKQVLLERLKNFSADSILLSYHNLPEKDVVKAAEHCNGCYKIPEPCSDFANDQLCYRNQCYQTTDDIRVALGWPKEKVFTGFQSKLGRAKWLDPNSLVVLSNIAQKGHKRLLVASPSFAADCLETLEEIAIEMRHLFLSEGGEAFDCSPCLNDHPSWIGALKTWIENYRSEYEHATAPSTTQIENHPELS